MTCEEFLTSWRMVGHANWRNIPTYFIKGTERRLFSINDGNKSIRYYSCFIDQLLGFVNTFNKKRI